jgi:hypothetical protein
MLDAHRSEAGDLMGEKRRAGEWQHRLRGAQRQRLKPGALAPDEDNCFHGRLALRNGSRV